MAGPGNLYNMDYESRIPGYHWMTAQFLQKSGEHVRLIKLIFAFDVEGDTLRMRMLKSAKYDEKSENPVDYEFGDLVLRYRFSFQGRCLTLSDGERSFTLEAGLKGENKDQTWLLFFGRVMPEEKKLDDITSFNCSYDEEDGFTSVGILWEKDITDEAIRNSVVSVSKDGLFTFTIPYWNGTKTYQFVYFYLDGDGLILTDGTELYFYHSWHGEYYTEKLSDVLGEDIDPRELTENQAEELIETQNSVIDDLSSSFQSNGVEADLNEKTGRVTMDARLLFDTDSAELSEEGRAYLGSFVRAYAPVVLDGEYLNKVVQVLVEGHTDPSGTDSYNRDLSQRRAQAVADLCLELEPRLAPYLEIKGCGSEDPVLAADGSVDMDASRRVVFKFILEA